MQFWFRLSPLSAYSGVYVAKACSKADRSHLARYEGLTIFGNSLRMSLEVGSDDWFEQERLHQAAQDGDLGEMRRLISLGVPVNRFDVISFTPLHYAAARGNIELMRILLESGADVNANHKEKMGNTPLSSVAYTCSLAVAKFLVDEGADPTISGWMAVTALDNSARRQDSQGKAVHSLLIETAARRSANWEKWRKFH